jgi:poly-gamma-glutamate capsule biosynthesis protein CapA/YwtB (metallophosphatase superfamily)
LVIPVMHWGWEHEPTASKRQRELARLMIDAGADAVIGGHPHVTQDTEQYHDKPIIYSLGNFVFDGFSDPDNNTGWLLLMDLDRQGVRSWRTVVATINSEGTPHPARKANGSCWKRGQLVASACNKTTTPKSVPD